MVFPILTQRLFSFDTFFRNPSILLSTFVIFLPIQPPAPGHRHTRAPKVSLVWCCSTMPQSQWWIAKDLAPTPDALSLSYQIFSKHHSSTSLLSSPWHTLTLRHLQSTFTFLHTLTPTTVLCAVPYQRLFPDPQMPTKTFFFNKYCFCIYQWKWKWDL